MSKTKTTTTKSKAKATVKSKAKSKAEPKIVERDELESELEHEDHELGSEFESEADILARQERVTAELQSHAYSPITHIKITYVDAKDMVMSESMSDFEYSEIIGLRTTEIAKGGPKFIVSDDPDPRKVAEAELAAKKCPLSIERIRTITPSGDIIAELWEANKLSIPRR